jgi:hypothetical protein
MKKKFTFTYLKKMAKRKIVQIRSSHSPHPEIVIKNESLIKVLDTTQT